MNAERGYKLTSAILAIMLLVVIFGTGFKVKPMNIPNCQVGETMLMFDYGESFAKTYVEFDQPLNYAFVSMTVTPYDFELPQYDMNAVPIFSATASENGAYVTGTLIGDRSNFGRWYIHLNYVACEWTR